MNPRDTIAPLAPLGGEFYLNANTGRTHVRMPAGGTGGGATSFADVPASEEQHVAYLKLLADQKLAESEDLQQRHEEAHDTLQEKRQTEAEGKSEADGKSAALDVNNPIGADTYGRPPQHVEGLQSQKGPDNPADGRDFTDAQPKSAPNQQDPNQPKVGDKEPAPVA